MSEENTFDLIDETKIKFDKEIIYDYPLTTTYASEFVKGNDVFQAPVTYSIDNNFYYTSDGKTSEFNFSKIHIGKLVHDNVENVSANNNKIIGEVVLEHSSNCYVCFFLESSSATEKNSLDAILSGGSANYEVELNNIIPKQDKCIHYKDGSKNVFVFTTPIYTEATSIDPIISNSLFNKYPSTDDYIVIPGNYLNQRDDDQIYIDCSPTGASDDEINTYNVPINSKMMSEKQQSDFMGTTVNFAFFTILSLVGYFIIPMFYKKVVIDMILFMNPGTGDEVNKDRLKAIASADVGIILTFVSAIMLFYTMGMTGDSRYTSLSLMLSLIAVLSASLITMKKSNPDFLRAISSNGRVIQLEIPMTTIKDEITKKSTEVPVGVSSSLGDIFKTIGDFFGFLLKLTPAFLAITLVGAAIPQIIRSMGILTPETASSLTIGGVLFSMTGLVCFKLIDKVEKLSKGEEA
jgi:hypothetical protein|uniref:Uncharacterized protein n=1 Tax=viral metagenome TaxID=1070528 RepID=A0A6C0IIJ8_9ZZZZ